MPETKPLTAYGLAFVALRLFAIYAAFNLFQILGTVWQVFSPTYSDRETMIAVLVPAALAQLVFASLAWFGAPFMAKRLVPPAQSEAQYSEPPSVNSWQNGLLTLLGFYLLYRLGMDIASAIATVDRRPSVRELVQAVVGIRLIAGLILILFPQVITTGLERLRNAISKRRGI
ncbi:hypothetical protein [Asticcacaulis sp. YBE204]|uniref:hypothetical protein n=1 Tax=Asticcacaulis sp. YBE204 TaxID=1282363 RepID=UPI0003C3C34B|nr:hypothetical protein [Asticcacaulis sp. YBE204]ESQ80042.1 hypothetical protein AEYBE204_05335 [Asticcacaulis sp. YBE204]